MLRTALILGANGRFGAEAARAFHEAGWHVRRQIRPGAKREGPGQAVEAEGTDPRALSRAAEGAALIVNALNPPYPAWTREIPRLTEAAMAAARASGARTIVPGNIYNYGSRLPEILNGSTPERPDHAKAKARVEMEAAWRASGLPVTVLRAGDFLGAGGREGWFETAIAAAAHKGRFTAPGPMDLPHAWAWLPDMTRAAVMLAEREAQPDGFEHIPFPGHTATLAELKTAMETALGRELKTRRFPWWALRAAGIVSPKMREMTEMRYLWERPHRIDGAALMAALPEFRATPLEDAVAAALRAAPR